MEAVLAVQGASYKQPLVLPVPLWHAHAEHTDATVLKLKRARGEGRMGAGCLAAEHFEAMCRLPRTLPPSGRAASFPTRSRICL